MKIYLRRFLTVLVLSGLIASLSHAADEEKPVPKVVAPTVTVSEAKMTDITERTTISGTLVAGEEVYVNTRINGYAIEELRVDIGDRVSKGDVLAVLDTLNLRSQVLQAEAELARSKAAIAQAQSQITAANATNREAQISLNRSTRLRRSGHLSQQDLDKAIANSSTSKANLNSMESALRVAKAQSKQSALQLEVALNNQKRAKIRAPISGIISSRSARLGAIASAGGEPLFKIIENGIVEMEAEVIETALGRIKEGQTVDLDIAGIGEIKGSVRLIAPTVDSRTRLAKVRIKLPDDDNIKPGLSASGWVLGAKRLALTVPGSAVTTEGGGVVVSVVKDGVVEKRTVVTGGLSRDGQREIVSGLKLGETVVTKSGVFYRSGDVVKVLPANDASTGDAQ